ncbi:MAG: helix-turn-helix transcriptional regulator [Actinomycetota bacterium]
MDALEVGRALRRRRRLALMTQAEVAAAMGTTQSAISRAETGQAMPSIRFLERYASATGRMLSIDIGPPARMRGARRTEKPSPVEAVAEPVMVPGPEEDDPVVLAIAQERTARERYERGEISISEYVVEKVDAELGLTEARSAAI